MDKKNNNEEEKIKYTPLSPCKNIENTGVQDVLLEALEDDEVKNIALTGPYGSGKSSIIQSLLNNVNNRNINNKSIIISMAKFDSEENQKAKDVEDLKGNQTQESSKDNSCENGPRNGGERNINYNKTLIDNIAEEIIKQLVYKEKHKKIPKSGLRRLDHIPKWKIICLAVCSIVFAISSIIMKNSIATNKDMINNIYKLITFKEINIESVAALAWIILSIVLLRLFLYLVFNKLRINEIKVFNNALKFDESKYDTIFDKYIDEIVYFFKSTKYKYIFFEDLDRFDQITIFSELRELNTLLNNSKQIDRPITFVYSIKDDMFTSENRTKFFDLIIPIIPCLTSNNIEKEMIEKAKSFYLFPKHNNKTERFLKNISIYIHDMRMLNNVFNEYQILYMQKKQNEDIVNEEELFSLVVLKNLYPELFYKLYNNNSNNLIDDIFKSIKLFKTNHIDENMIDFGNVSNGSVLSGTNVLEILSDDKSIEKAKNDYPFLIYAIQKEYISKKYFDSISKIDFDSLTSNDETFIKSLHAFKQLPIDYSLNNIGRILEHLENSDFSKKGIINYDLLEYMLKNEDKEQLDSFLQNEILKTKDGFDFILYFSKESAYEKQLYYELTQHPEIIKSYIEMDIVDNKDRLELLEDMILVLGWECFLNFNIDNCIKKYFEKNMSYI